MGKGKLEKFAELKQLSNVLEYPFGVLKTGVTFPHKGMWREAFFGNDNPIVLELGCGKGEYSVGLARRFPDKNFIGIDIKGNRMWTGAKEASVTELGNVAFLRTEIELLHHFFAPNEVDEIWITFPDPQMKKVRKRLTSVAFLKLYHSILKEGGLLHLKTDSPFLFNYTKAVAESNQLPILRCYTDIHGTVLSPEDEPLQSIRTYYENQWMERGFTIKYLSLLLDERVLTAEEPEVDLEWDSYRSFGRHYASQKHSISKEPQPIDISNTIK